MINKEKIIKKADKFVKQGKIDNAISEYNKLIEQNPTDLSTINTVGDLYARIGKTTEAIKQFKQIAQFYSKDGFILKAIAIYKKINKLDPSDKDIYLELAELYVRQNLPVEAASHYLVVAQYQAQHGNLPEALEMYNKVIELNPDNLKVRIKKAELLIKNNLNEQAFEEFLFIAHGFKEKGYYEEADLMLARAKNLAPERREVEVLEGQLLLEKGDFGQAEEKFKELLDNNPEDTKLLALLAETYQKQNIIDKSEEYWEKILNKDPDSEIAMLGMGRIALKRGDITSGFQSFEPVIHKHIEAEEYDHAISFVEEILGVSSRNLNALQKLLEIYTILNNEGKIRQILKQIIEEAKVDENEKLVYSSLKRLQELSPEDQTIRAELEALGPKLEQLGLMEDLDSGAEETAKTQDLQEFVIEEGDITLEEVEKELEEAHMDVERPADQEDISTERKEIAGDEATDILEESEETTPRKEREPEEEPAPEHRTPAMEEDPDKESVSSHIEEVDFYLEQGLEEEARKILSDLSVKFPDHPLLKEKLEKIGKTEKPADAEAQKNEVVVPGREAISDEIISSDLTAPDGSTLANEESFDFILREFREDVHKQLGPDDFENHYNLGIAYKEMNLLNEAIDEFQIAAKDPSRLKECCSMTGICFLEKGMPDVATKWFSKGMEQYKEPEEEESYLGMLYYLGIAYEYNGEFEKSLDTFNKLFNLAEDYRDVQEKIKNLKSYKNK